jgi:hypothetical protein
LEIRNSCGSRWPEEFPRTPHGYQNGSLSIDFGFALMQATLKMEGASTPCTGTTSNVATDGSELSEDAADAATGGDASVKGSNDEAGGAAGEGGVIRNSPYLGGIAPDDLPRSGAGAGMTWTAGVFACVTVMLVVC